MEKFKILVYAITRDGIRIPLGVASDMDDAKNLIDWVNSSFHLNDVVDYEYISDPSEKELEPIREGMENFVKNEKERVNNNDFLAICKDYFNKDISLREAISKIESLYEGNEDRIEDAIRELFEYKDDCICECDECHGFYDDDGEEDTCIEDVPIECEDEDEIPIEVNESRFS